MIKKIILLLGIIFSIYYFKDAIYNNFNIVINQKNKILKKEEDVKYYLINVLDKKEFDDAHIKNSMNVPFAKVNNFLNEINNKDIPIIFYCSNYYCTASDSAAKIAIKKGFKNVFVYKGGMAEWYQASQEDNKFEYEGKAQEEYLKVVILPQEEIFDSQSDIIYEDNIQEESFKIISINNLQIFLKEGMIIK